MLKERLQFEDFLEGDGFELKEPDRKWTKLSDNPRTAAMRLHSGEIHAEHMQAMQFAQAYFATRAQAASTGNPLGDSILAKHSPTKTSADLDPTADARWQQNLNAEIALTKVGEGRKRLRRARDAEAAKENWFSAESPTQKQARGYASNFAEGATQFAIDSDYRDKQIKGAITGTAGFFAGNMAADGVALAEGLAGLLTHAIGSEEDELWVL